MAARADASMSAEEAYARNRGFHLRDAVLFLIDWRLSMATGGALACALRAVAAAMRTRILEGGGDLFGVVAFGAGVDGKVMEGSRQTWKGVRIVVPLEAPCAQSIVKLQQLARRLDSGHAQGMSAGERDSRRQEPDFSFGEGPCKMQEALWAVRHQFVMCKVAGATSRTLFNRQRCIVLTDDDEPQGKENSRGAESNAADLSEAGVSVEVMFLRSEGGNTRFDQGKFYKAIVYVDRDEYEERRGKYGGIVEVDVGDELEVVVGGRLAKKRTTARAVLHLDRGLSLGVGLYSCVRRASRPVAVKVQSSTSEKLACVTQRLCSWSGMVLTSADDIRMNFDKVPFMTSGMAVRAERGAASGEVAEMRGGGEGKVESEREGGDADCPLLVSAFTAAELRALGRAGEPDGMTLYGFRDMDRLRPEHAIKPPYFVYPDESVVKGSTKAFAALLRSMLTNGKMAIVLRSSQGASTGPRFCALLPQAETFDEEGVQTTPPGMHLVPLVYKNDVYVAWREETETLAQELVACGGQRAADDGGRVLRVAERLVERLRHKQFDATEYLNPAMERYYAALEVKVGVTPTFAPPEDTLEPDVDLIRRRAVSTLERGGDEVDLLEVFRDLTLGPTFHAAEVALLYGTKSGLRAKETATRQLKRKAERDAKAEEALESIRVEAYRAASGRGQLARAFNLAQLRLYCTAFGLPTSGNRASVVARIEHHLNPDSDDEKVV
jgi:hypothetical protein